MNKSVSGKTKTTKAATVSTTIEPSSILSIKPTPHVEQN
jgi:hypothetical protein